MLGSEDCAKRREYWSTWWTTGGVQLYFSVSGEGRKTQHRHFDRGASPEIAASVRSRIACMIPADMEKILDYLNGLRPLAKEYIRDDTRRAAFLKDMAGACMDRNAVFDEQETMQRLAEYTGSIEDGQQACGGTAGEVLLVGAGCGCHDLITVRGLCAVRRARVLVYDDLIDPRLLGHASENCERIYVGKRSGKHSMRQEQINALLVEKAQEGGLVVRLKGGDPFVFGRGMEELAALREAGIDAAYVGYYVWHRGSCVCGDSGDAQGGQPELSRDHRAHGVRKYGQGSGAGH